MRADRRSLDRFRRHRPSLVIRSLVGEAEVAPVRLVLRAGQETIGVADTVADT
jgi:hypothetical protein